MHNWTRRSFMTGAIGAVSAAAAIPRSAWSLGTSATATMSKHYRDAIVIDTLSSVGGDDDDDFAPISAQQLEDVRRSGLTAINITVDSVGIGGFTRSFEDTIRLLAYVTGQAAAHPEAFLQVRNVADIHAAKRSRRLGLIYGLQDSAPIGEDLQRVDTLCDLGVRVFQLTYNKRNLVGDGCLEPEAGGLSKFGRELVGRLNARKVIVDLAHASKATTLDACAQSKSPIAISHTGCAALNPHPRNKTDEELKRVADRGGYVGIYLISFFLRKEGETTADDLIAHLEHAIDVCGSDAIGIGTDGTVSPTVVTESYAKMYAAWVIDRQKKGIAAPGEEPKRYQFIPDLNSADRYEKIADRLARRGHPWSTIEKILGGNFLRYASTVWGG